jgi:FKBP-type peptidyl-prolyl cis-trans isomerase FkpA
MKFLLLPAACALVLTLGACGGGGDNNAATPATTVSNPTALKTTDTVVGTGATAANGDRVQVNYTGWLYNDKATDFKGTKFDASVAGKPFTFVIGAANTNESAITGFSQGVLGMKVGGKRTLLIPANLAYGAQGAYNGATLVIPPNSGVVFEVELVKDCGTAAC